jgi:hypothetical protein
MIGLRLGFSITLLLGGFFDPLAAEAEQAAKIARIGYLAGDLARIPYMPEAFRAFGSCGTPGRPVRRESAGCGSGAGSRHGSRRSPAPAARPLARVAPAGAPATRRSRRARPGECDTVAAPGTRLLRGDEPEPHGFSFSEIPCGKDTIREGRTCTYRLRRGPSI